MPAVGRLGNERAVQATVSDIAVHVTGCKPRTHVVAGALEPALVKWLKIERTVYFGKSRNHVRNLPWVGSVLGAQALVVVSEVEEVWVLGAVSPVRYVSRCK
jgi:hypothetical protein